MFESMRTQTGPTSLRGRRSRAPGAVVYGPLVSRRFGRSLGVNLTPPGCRACSFDCVYCELSGRAVPAPGPDAAWPTPRGIGSALHDALRQHPALDSITISGAGEPTLHPDLGGVLAVILAAARRTSPRVPVRILTNGSGAVRPEVRRALDRLDERIVTVDADAERVDRPDPHAPLGGIVYGISLLRDVTAQSCFIDGAVSNVGDASVRAWTDLVGELRPARVQVYTVNRRPAARGVHAVSADRLAQIAQTLRARTGIEARIFA